jgi:hypothetical protein
MGARFGIVRTALALLLLAGALSAVVGCSRGIAPQFADDTVGTSEQTASVTTTAAATETGTAQSEAAPSGSTPGSASSQELNSKDAAELDAELSAIQSELDRLSVPSDSDFDSIGSGLE